MSDGVPARIAVSAALAKSTGECTRVHYDNIITLETFVPHETFNFLGIDRPLANTKDRILGWIFHLTLHLFADNCSHLNVPDVFANMPLLDLCVVLLSSEACY